jgi:hypothetical protein
VSAWLVVFKASHLAELGVMVNGWDMLDAVSEALDQWPMGDVRDIIKVVRT